MKIELTAEQEQIIKQGCAVEVVDPQTKLVIVITARAGVARQDASAIRTHDSIASGILSAQRAFWRDLPHLLEDQRNTGKWIAYHRDQRLGMAASGNELIRDIMRRDIPEDEYDLFVVEERDLPPWEAEEIEGGGNEVDDIVHGKHA